MVGPMGMGSGGWFDPYKIRDEAHKAEIDERGRQRDRRDPNKARLEAEIEKLHAERGRDHRPLIQDPIWRAVFRTVGISMGLLLLLSIFSYVASLLGLG